MRTLCKLSVPAIRREFNSLAEARPNTPEWLRSVALLDELMLRPFAKRDSLAIFHIQTVDYMRESLRTRRAIFTAKPIDT